MVSHPKASVEYLCPIIIHAKLLDYVIVNGIIPDEVGFFNDLISKKTLRGLNSTVIKAVGMAKACEFLDGIKNLGYRIAYVAGLSFNLGDIIIPPEKEAIVERGRKEVE